MARAEPLPPVRPSGDDGGEPAQSSPLRHLPNLISGVRIALVFPAVSAVIDTRYDLALCLVLIAGLSDGLDGLLARSFHWHSQLGAMLDPLADKLLFVSLYVVFAWQALLPTWLVVVLIGRDVVIVGGAIAYRVLVGPFAGGATRLSKLNTGVALLLGLGVLAAAHIGLDYRDSVDSAAAQALVLLGAIAFATAALSGALYVARWSARARTALASRAGGARD
jgi:cardiolipin synthase